MPTTTPNLGLKKPLGNEIVSRQAYNENLDLLDQNVTEYKREIEDLPRQSITLSHGLNAVNAPRASLLRPKFTGRTLVNLLGKDGKGDRITNMLTINAAATVENEVFKVTTNLTGTEGFAYVDVSSHVSKNGKYFLLIGEVKNGNATNVRLQLSDYASYAPQSQTVTDSLNFNLVWCVFDTNNIDNTSPYRGATIIANGSAGQYVYARKLRLYELTQGQKNELSTLTPDQIAAKYPYVNSVQMVQNPAVKAEGVNLLPPFSQWTNSAGTLTDISLSSISVVKSDVGYKTRSFTFYPIVGQTYTFKITIDISNIGGDIGSGGYYNLSMYDSKNQHIGFLDSPPYATTNGTITITKTFIVPSETKSINIIVGCDIGVTGTFTFSNPMLILGDTIPDHYLPNDPSYLYLQTPLYEGETLEEIDGQWMRTKKWEKKVLDGSLDWSFSIDGAGFKRLYVPNFTATHGAKRNSRITNNQLVGIKYDGKILGGIGTDASFDNIGTGGNDDHLFISVADIDSGWGENYTPTADEIKAYFYGWKMYTRGQSVNTTYDGTGTKGWVKLHFYALGDGSHHSHLNGYADGQVPTASYPEWTPYTLHYQLATPVTEVVPHEGELRVHEGLNQVEVFEGVVVRELANPKYDANNKIYFINHTSASLFSAVANKVEKFLSVFENTKPTLMWGQSFSSQFSYGKTLLGAYEKDFDPTAQYSVTYQALPEEFTAPLLSVDATYDSNIKSTVDTLVDELAKVTTDVTALEMALRNRGLLRKNPIYTAKPSAIQTVVNGTLTNVIFDYPIYDNYNQYNADNKRFTCKVPGYYLISARMWFSENGTGFRYVALRLNESEDLAYVGLPSPTDSAWRSGIQTLRYLNPGDYITVIVRQTSGTTLSISNFSAETAINIVKVGD
ncbi:hypothetical protein [Desulforamulus ruminis]|uniref:Uncharacterized protein n=1 Tax=Desulforamulus ruminis (strain ATCC 23193 / DSM 2154 / NCIMB 8452 / DL) TaxID=696281 RepID=F6DS98_DESRL|nr:hypothetical protein [Desulforamulus ruminis]AEG59877.1 hypothetical protein Desru_1612 [Desulforamulus ruminis DSM 2154]